MNKTLTDLTDADWVSAYKKYKNDIEIVRWWWIKFWWILFFILLGSYFVFVPQEIRLTNEQINFLFVMLVFSAWMIISRIWYKEGFKDWYEFGYKDGAEWAFKELNNLTDEDMFDLKEIESLSEAEKRIE